MNRSSSPLHLMTEEDPASETSYNLNIPKTMSKGQHNFKFACTFVSLTDSPGRAVAYADYSWRWHWIGGEVGLHINPHNPT
jgi:hypothetical protein